MRIARSLPLLLLIASSAPAGVAAAQKGPPAWQQAERAIRADYAKREAGTTILEITQGERSLFPFWVAYEGSVSVQRSGGRRDRERVGVTFWLVRESWELDGVELLGRRELADIKPPSQEDTRILLRAAWSADKCEGYDITEVTFEGEPRFQREAVSDPARAKRAFVYAVDIRATGNGKSRMSERGMQYSNRTQNLLTWDADAKSWSVDPRQVRCTGWVKQASSSAQQASAPAAIAGIASSDPPSDADVIRVFTQAWSVLRPDFSVSAITVKSKEPHQYQERRWITYKLAIMVAGTDQGSKSMAGKKYLCEPNDFSSVLKWDAEAKQWKVDESMVKNFNESSCTPKS